MRKREGGKGKKVVKGRGGRERDNNKKRRW